MRAVIRSSRQRFAIVLLSVFTLLGQLMLPSVHAQNWARDAGNPLLAAFCGETSPALMAQLRQFAPPELVKQFDAAKARMGTGKTCVQCLSLHGGLLGAVAPALPTFARFALERIDSVIHNASRALFLRLAQPRGPPSIS